MKVGLDSGTFRCPSTGTGGGGGVCAFNGSGHPTQICSVSIPWQTCWLLGLVEVGGLQGFVALVLWGLEP